ncbi:MAG: hypothetical protein ACREBU_10870 [Nitrososphaera sp.]
MASPIFNFARSTAGQIVADILILAVVASIIGIIFGFSINNLPTFAKHAPQSLVIFFAPPLTGTALILLGIGLWFRGHGANRYVLVSSIGAAVILGWIWFLMAFASSSCYFNKPCVFM